MAPMEASLERSRDHGRHTMSSERRVNKLESEESKRNGVSPQIDAEKFGIRLACATVEKLLEQIHLNDCPPVNEELGGPSPSSNSSSKDRSFLNGRRQRKSPTNSHSDGNRGKTRFSRPKHSNTDHLGHDPADGRESPMLSPTASFVSELSSAMSSNWEMNSGRIHQAHPGGDATTPSLWLDHYHTSQKQAEMRLGHVALATLCARTLDSIDQAGLSGSNRTAVHPSPTGITLAESSSTESGIRAPPSSSLHVAADPVNSSTMTSPSNKKSWKMPWKKRHETDAAAALGELSETQVERRQKSPRRRGKDVDAPNLSRLVVDSDNIFSSQGQPATPVNRLLLVGSEDSADAVYTPNDDFSESPPHDERNGYHHHREENEQYERNDLALYKNSSSGEMEGIVEEGEADVIREYRYAPQAQIVVQNPHVPSVQVPTQPKRLQMYGSEYARFLSPTVLGPDMSRSKKNSRKSSLGHRRSGTGRVPGRRPLNIEEASNATLTGPVTDIVITHGSEIPPKGYCRVSQTCEDSSALHVHGRGSARVHINVKKESNWDRAAQRPCVSALAVIFPDRQEFVPPGFCVVRHYRGREDEGTPKDSSSSMAANLNFGSSGERVFLCYRRSREGNPITGILPLQPKNNETIPEGYTVIEHTPRGHVADINSGGGAPVFLAFRQRLANLETLRPLPLVLSVHYSNPFGSPDDSGPLMDQSSRHRPRRLRAYYCTGGTVVASDVGSFHIMDRSTHSMLSPSSIANRLEMIEASRQRAASESQKKKNSASIYASSSHMYGDTDPEDGSLNDSLLSSASSSHHLSSRSMSVDSDFDAAEGPRDQSLIHNLSVLSHQSPKRDEDMSYGSSRDRSAASSRRSSSPANVQTLFSTSDQELQDCMKALNFIPLVETAHQPGLVGGDAGDATLLQARVTALTPLLTACYTHHGGSSNIAVEGLTKLLTETEFFRQDVETDENLRDGPSSRLTLLDLAVQTCCDVATSSARETSFGGCLEFVQFALQYSRGRLSTRTIGYVQRFCLFVFYFGASVPLKSKSLVWSADYKEQSDPRGLRSVVARGDVPLLYEPSSYATTVGGRSYVPGGAPQAAALALKELLSLTIGRLGSIPLANEYIAAMISPTHADGSTTQFGAFIQSLVSSLIDETVLRVDIANYTQLALHQIHRSGGSELFWHDMMTSCGSGLFGNIRGLERESKAIYITSFALLTNIVKTSCGRIRYVPQTNDLVPRDVASKILSLELLEHFLVSLKNEMCGGVEKEEEAVETMMFAVRRLVSPCLLSNTLSALEDARVFRRITRVVSELWGAGLFRNHMKVELGVLISHFALSILALGPQLRPPEQLSEAESTTDAPFSTGPFRAVRSPLLPQQIDVLFELSRWFNPDSTDFVQLFLNFDAQVAHDSGSDRLLPQRLTKLTERLCGAVCTIAEQAGDIICEQIRLSQMSNNVPPPSPMVSTATRSSVTDPRDASLVQEPSETMYLREGARQLQTEALGAITQMLKCLATSAALSAGIPFRSGPGLSEDSFRPEDTEDGSALSTMDWNENSKTPRRHGRTSPVHSVSSSHTDRHRDESIHGYWRSAIAAERHRAAKSPRPKTPDLHQRQTPARSTATGEDRADSSEDSKSFSGNDEDTLATAVEISKRKSLRKSIDYLVACDFLTPSPRDIAAFLRVHGARFEQKILGEYLSEGGTDGADAEYWNLIRFNFLRATNFVGMNVEEGLRHFLIHSGFRLPGEAQRIDRLISTYAQCFWEDNAGDRTRCPFSDQDTVYLVSFAIIMLNTDLHKTHTARHKKRMSKAEFINNLRGVDSKIDMSRDYLEVIYDSIEADPIELFDETDSHKGEMACLKSMIRNAKASEELLRGLSVHDHTFYSIDDYRKSLGFDPGSAALKHLCREAFASIWHHVHGLIHAALDSAHADPKFMVASLELLKNAMYIAICLDMNMERTAFMVQLARFKTFAERRGDYLQHHEEQGYKLEEWYGKLTQACDEAEEESKLSALVQVNAIIRDLHGSLAIDVAVKREMTRVVRTIRDGEFLLNDPTRSFIRQGDFQKQNNHRLGRTTTSLCHLILFSDVLLYCKGAGGEESSYKIHEELPLHLIKVTDWFPDKSNKKQHSSTNLKFQIHHPRKSFVVIAGSVEERKAWVGEIRSAAQTEMSRLADLERARVMSLERR